MGLFQGLTDILGFTDSGAPGASMGQAQALYAGMKPPELSPIELQRMVSAGEITPEYAEIILQEQNAYKDIYVDPRLKAQQMKTLQGVQEIADTGMTASDRADLANIAQQEAIAERGSREAIIQQAQQRGVSGSGLDMAQRLASQQAGATRRSMRDTEVAGTAADRRIQALQQAGQLAGGMRSQDYGEQADIAKAQQMINQFNVQNTQQQLAERNRLANAANEANLQRQQDIMNQNVALANQEEMYRQQLPQQQFQNQLGISGQQANLYGQQAQAQAAQNAAGSSAFGSLLGSAATAGAIYAASDEKCKKDIKLSPDEIDALLNDITGYSFRYKDEDVKRGIGSEGAKIGVMAQDVEDYLPQAVEEMDDGEEKLKMLNNAEILPAVLASVGRLNDRLNTLEEEVA